MSLVVKAYHPWRSRLVTLLLLVVLLLAAWALFEYGRFSAGFDSFKAGEQHKKLVKRSDDLESQITSLREQKAVLERDSQIKQKAYDDNPTIKR